MQILLKYKPVYCSDIKNKKQWSAYSIYIIAFMEKGTQVMKAICCLPFKQVNSELTCIL